MSSCCIDAQKLVSTQSAYLFATTTCDMDKLQSSFKKSNFKKNNLNIAWSLIQKVYLLRMCNTYE